MWWADMEPFINDVMLIEGGGINGNFMKQVF